MDSIRLRRMNDNSIMIISLKIKINIKANDNFYGEVSLAA